MKRVLISKGWAVRRPGGTSVTVDLPHDGSISLPRDPAAPGGCDTGWFVSTDLCYSRVLRLPAGATHAILDIDGAYMCAAVTMNGDRLCMHPHGYTPWTADLSAHIHPGGADELRIETSGLQPSTRWYSGSGLYRDVFLWLGGAVRIEPRATFVTTPEVSAERALVRVATRVSMDFVSPVSLRATVLGPSCAEAASAEVGLTAFGDADGVGGADAFLELEVVHPDLWDIGHGALYTLRLEVVSEDGAVLDEETTRFGIRSLSFNPENGFRINGRPEKLRGGCIHHDHGVLGAAAFPAAERRRASLLQTAGFDAIRVAHNPPSLALLEACDELGILLLDEAFDMWNCPKRPCDYHLWFADWWARDIEAMVLRDRNHPCVVSYSIGNEISERSGHSDGAALAARLAAECRRHDPTRAVTSAFCELWDLPQPDPSTPDDARDSAFPHCRIDARERNEKLFAPLTAPAAEALDVVGYNYMHYRYAIDRERFPHRVVWGTETFPRDFFDSWKATLENTNVCGDFVWTAFDYLGEAGIGRGAWHSDGERLEIPQTFPWRVAWDADLDLCGNRRPQSYLREAVWLGNAEPQIWTRHPRFNGLVWGGTPWSFPDLRATWTFADIAPGTPVRCYVYTDADEIAFELNGRGVGSARPEKGCATLDVPWEPGRLVARAVKGGATVGESALETTGAPAALALLPESPSLVADRRDLAFVRIEVRDGAGRRVDESAAEITCRVEGGELLGVFSADPKNEDAYTTPSCHAYEGRALAVIRAAGPGQVVLAVSSPALPDASCMLIASRNTSDACQV
jgi:beta-galactosidase